jgi:hypothetical protein
MALIRYQLFEGSANEIIIFYGILFQGIFAEI